MPDGDDTTKTGAASASAGALLRLAASVLGASGVALGALGSHALHNRLMTTGKLEQWKTAVLYQLLHAVAVLSISIGCDQPQAGSNNNPKATAVLSRSRGHWDHPPNYPMAGRAGQCMALGTLLFSGSIYLLCLDVGPKKLLGPATPVGGLFMIAGWVMLGSAKKY